MFDHSLLLDLFILVELLYFNKKRKYKIKSQIQIFEKFNIYINIFIN